MWSLFPKGGHPTPDFFFIGGGTQPQPFFFKPLFIGWGGGSPNHTFFIRGGTNSIYRGGHPTPFIGGGYPTPDPGLRF